MSKNFFEISNDEIVGDVRQNVTAVQLTDSLAGDDVRRVDEFRQITLGVIQKIRNKIEGGLIKLNAIWHIWGVMGFGGVFIFK